MTISKDRPFRSKKEIELERALEAQYRSLGNEDLVAAIQQQQQASQPKTDQQG
ncbi:MAG: hypothetical protein IT535_08600 [Bauldia sp.]|nr:hypothetical protein [Bauldia sp.]